MKRPGQLGDQGRGARGVFGEGLEHGCVPRASALTRAAIEERRTDYSRAR